MWQLFQAFILSHWILFGVELVAIILYLLDDESVFSDVKIIDTAELVHLMNKGVTYRLIDLRSSMIYQKRHIPHAKQERDLKDDFQGAVIFYCDDGSVSIEKAVVYQKTTSNAVYVLRDGFTKWIQEDLPCVN